MIWITLKDLVNSLFAYESDEDLDRTSIDVDKFLSELPLHGSLFAYEENKNLTMDIEDNLPPLTCDPLKLKQVMINMIKNAFEATDEHGIIEVSAKLRLKRIVIIVSDNGHGIPEDQLPNIFDFMTSYKKEAAVLALPIARRSLKPMAVPSGLHQKQAKELNLLSFCHWQAIEATVRYIIIHLKIVI